MTGMKRKIAASVLVFVYINLLPYLSRLHGGWDWAAQYLPDTGHLLFGLIFFQAFASLPSVPIIATIWLGKLGRVGFVLSLLTATAFLAYWHHDYDLASDAQAAIGLIFIPIYTCTPTLLAAVVGVGISFGLKRIKGEVNRRARTSD